MSTINMRGTQTGRTQCAEPNQANGPRAAHDVYEVKLRLKVESGLPSPETWDWHALIGDGILVSAHCEIVCRVTACEDCGDTENAEFMTLRQGRLVCPACQEKL